MTLLLSLHYSRTIEGQAAPLAARHGLPPAAAPSQAWRKLARSRQERQLCIAAAERGAAAAVDASEPTPAQSQSASLLGLGLQAAAVAGTSLEIGTSGTLAAPEASGTLRAESLECRPAEPEDWWPVADVHCSAFYPQAASVWHSLLRLDRLLSLHVGHQAKNSKFACLVAAKGDGPPTPSGQSGTMPVNPLVTAFAQAFLPRSIQVNFGSTHESRGLLGAVVVDTMLLFVPPKIVRTPGGNTREVKRRRMAYLSNLAVAPSARRRGVGRQLLLEAEALARSWGCRCMALHVDGNNVAAVELYRREGYREAGRQSAWEQFVEGRKTPLVLMLKRLGCGSGSEEGSSSGGAGRG